MPSFPLTLLPALLLVAHSAGCSSEDYAMDGGDTQPFLVEGNDPYVAQATGQVSIVDSREIAQDLYVVTLHCELGSPCTGTVHGC